MKKVYNALIIGTIALLSISGILWLTYKIMDAYERSRKLPA